MSVVHTTPDQLPRLVRGHRRQIGGALRTAMRKSARAGRRILRRLSPGDFGLGWTIEAGEVGDDILVEVVNDHPAGGALELGARPHAVSAAGRRRIAKWVQKYFGYSVIARSGPRKGQRVQRRITGDTRDDPFVEEMVRAIVAKMEREGQKPTYFVRDGLPEITSQLVEDVLRELEGVDPRKAA